MTNFLLTAGLTLVTVNIGLLILVVYRLHKRVNIIEQQLDEAEES